MTPDEPWSRLHEIESTIGDAVYGQRATIRMLLAAVISGGHALVEDRPGVGKTTLVKALSRCLGLDMQRIQGTADLLPADLTGTHVFDPATAEWSFRPGPLLAPVVLVDELNRATPKAQSALFEAMAEGQVTVGGETFDLPTPHVVLATQNPTGELGTYPLVDAQLDRFAVVLTLGLAGRSAERTMLAEPSRPGREAAEPVLDSGELDRVIDHVAAMTASEPVLTFILDIVDQLRGLDDSLWLSSRVPIDMLATARGLACVNGRTYVAPDDVRDVAFATVRHRIKGRVCDDAVHRTIRAVPIPVDGNAALPVGD